jgi:hypothetical protein
MRSSAPLALFGLADWVSAVYLCLEREVTHCIHLSRGNRTSLGIFVGARFVRNIVIARVQSVNS